MPPRAGRWERHKIVGLLLMLGLASGAASEVTAQEVEHSPVQLSLLQQQQELDPPSQTAPNNQAIRDSVAAIRALQTQPAPTPLPPADDGLNQIRYAHRSTTAAVLMTIPFPGWGQFYGESPFWGAVAFGVQMWFYGNVVLEMRRGERQRVARDDADPGSPEREYRDSLALEHTERARDFVWWAAGSVLLVSLDAYVSVQLVDFDAPDPPTPDLDRSPGSSGGNGGGLALTLQLPF